MENPHTTEQSAPSARLRPVIAIDGPAGAGKSTVAAHLARHFGLLNLETGAMYRALALKAIENDLDFDEAEPLVALCRATTIRLEPTREGNRVLLDGMDVSRRIREGDVTAAASRVSVHPAVRAWMVAQQRALGAPGGVVMEGRDIGTAVFPDAEVKIFLDAAPEVRGNRRFRQVAANVLEVTEATEAGVLAELQARDARDRNRAESPLRPAEDAILVDSTGLSLDGVLARCEALVQSWLDRAAK
jgi:cytidylate kinase